MSDTRMERAARKLAKELFPPASPRQDDICQGLIMFAQSEARRARREAFKDMVRCFAGEESVGLAKPKGKAR